VSEFTLLIIIEQHSDGTPAAAGVIQWLIEGGKGGRFVHYIDDGCPQWEILCALEDALIDSRQNEGWTFVAGHIDGDDETGGWLEYEGWVVMPYGPERKKHGTDLGLWRRDDFDELSPVVFAKAAAAPDSGIIINRQLRLMEQIDAI
jgi:hypothetical protein